MIKNAFISGILSLVMCLMAYSVQADEMKIGIVDFQKVIEGSSAYRDIRSQLDKKADAFRADAAKIEEKLQKGYQELDSQKSVLSADAYSKKRKQLDKEVESSQEKFHMERLSLDKASSQAISVLEKSFFQIIEKNAKARELSLVLASSSVLFGNSNLDITDATIEELNKTLPSVKVNFEDINDKEKSASGAAKSGDSGSNSKK